MGWIRVMVRVRVRVKVGVRVVSVTYLEGFILWLLIANADRFVFLVSSRFFLEYADVSADMSICRYVDMLICRYFDMTPDIRGESQV